MPVAPTYPGVYVEEIPSPVRTIVGVSTSVTAFLGYTGRGPTNRATQVMNYGDFERTFGGLDADSAVSYAVQHFFRNGGSEAWIVRAARGARAASVTMANADTGGVNVLVASAVSEGVWGNQIRLQVDYDTSNPNDTFNLRAIEYRDAGGTLVPAVSEVHRNLSMDSDSPRYAPSVVNANSTIVHLDRVAGVETGLAANQGTSTSGDIPLAAINGLTTPSRITVTVNGRGPIELALNAPTGADGARLTSIADDIVAKAAAAGVALAHGAVSGAGTARSIQFQSTATGEHSSVTFESAPQSDAARVLRLGVLNGGIEMSAAAALRPAASGTRGSQMGSPPSPAADTRIRLTVHRGVAATTIPIGLPTDEVQQVAVAGATSGTFLLSYQGNSTAALPFNASNAAVTSALEAVPGIGAGNVLVQNGPGTWDITFRAGMGERDVTELVPDGSGLVGATPTITVTTTTPGQPPIELWLAANQPTTPQGMRAALQAALVTAARLAPGAADELRGAVVRLVGGALQVIPGGHPDTWFEFANTAAGVAAATRFGIGGTATPQNNVGSYSLGVGAVVRGQAAVGGGNDGQPPGVADLVGSEAAKTGLYALENVDLFNLLCLPGLSDGDLVSASIAYCERRRAFLILDLPETIDTLPEAQAWIRDPATAKSKNAAAYFPWVQLPDPLQNYRLRAFPPSGILAGLYARTDGTRGVWKAPAGTEANLVGPRGLSYLLSDQENGTLNPLGLNAIRAMKVYGIVSWGARTLFGADALANEWKYIPVRRLALFIEESLYRGTQWVVFEPNDRPLWAQIRLNVGAFMHSLFRQGAFQGSSPREAYLVKCDDETTTQDDINRGIVNIVVGFAPLKPAEFVILKITQLAGQVET